MPATARSAHYTRPWLAPYQLSAIFCSERYAVVEATTKAGKTAACLVWIFEQAAESSAGRNHWWVAPVYAQAEIAYKRMKRAIPRALFKSNDTERFIELANGAIVSFKSGEKPDNLFGEDVYSAVIDEASRLRADSWHAVRSTLSATRGPARIIGNVRGRLNWAYDMARRAERGAIGMHYAKITWHDAVAAGILDAAEIEDARTHLPPSVFRELYEAEPADIEGRVYRDFKPENVDSDVCDLGGTILVGMDFNVNPMSAVVACRAADQLHVFDEVVIANSNTQEMAEELRRRYPEPRDVAVYPDPSGSARKTSAPVGQTDFAILRQFGFRLITPRAAIPVVDRINEVNGLFCNAKGERRLFVHSRCTHLLDGLEGLTYKDGTNQPEKDRGLDHICFGEDTRIETDRGRRRGSRRPSVTTTGSRWRTCAPHRWCRGGRSSPPTAPRPRWPPQGAQRTTPRRRRGRSVRPSPRARSPARYSPRRSAR